MLFVLVRTFLKKNRVVLMLIMLTAFSVFSVFSKIGLDWKQVQLLLQLGNVVHSKTQMQAIMTLNVILKLSIKNLQKVPAAVYSCNSQPKSRHYEFEKCVVSEIHLFCHHFCT